MTRFKFALLVVLVLAPFVASPRARGDVAGDSLAESYRLSSAGNIAGAIHAMSTAVSERPKEYFPILRLAYLQLLNADYNGAAASYLKAASLKRSALEPRLGAEQALVSAGRFEEAERVAHQALKIDASNYTARSRLAWSLYKQKRYQEAADEYQTVLDLYPSDTDMLQGYAQSLLAMGRKPEAAVAYQQLLDMIPASEAATAGLAACQ